MRTMRVTLVVKLGAIVGQIFRGTFWVGGGETFNRLEITRFLFETFCVLQFMLVGGWGGYLSVQKGHPHCKHSQLT